MRVFPICLFFLSGVAFSVSAAPRLDLTGHDFEKEGPVSLEGDWSAQWSSGSRSANLQWDLVLPPLPPGGGAWALQIDEARSAFRVVVNGVVQVQVGVPASTEAEEVPRLVSGVWALDLPESPVTLSLEISSWKDPSMGRISPPKLGTLSQLEAEFDLRMIVAALVAGALLIMALYHFALFSLRRRNLAHLFFAFLCVLLGSKALFDAPRAIFWLVEDLSWVWYLRLWVWQSFLAVPAYVAYLRWLYPNETPRWLLPAVAGPIGVLSLLVLFTPPAFFLTFNPSFFTGTAILVVLTMVILAWAAARRREGAIATLIVGFILAASVLHDLLVGFGVFRAPTLAPLGLLAFVVSQAVILGRQLNTSHQLLERRVEERTGELREKVELIRQLAVTDHLTGIGNRRKLAEALEEEHARATRHGRSFAIVLSDIDLFKRVNDEFGHDKGDEVLRLVATAIGTSLRQGDSVGRWGGEEFLVLLPESDHEATASAAERMRAKVEALDCGLGRSVTLSVGWAVWSPGLTISQLLKTADIALYHAKESGRNRVQG